jgi:hypothetical protein
LLKRQRQQFRKSLEERIRDCGVHYSDTVINAFEKKAVELVSE